MKSELCEQLIVVLLLFALLFSACSSKYLIKSPQYEKYKGEANHHMCLIRASKQHIFDILTQEESFRKICPEGTSITHETVPPYRVGTLIRTNVDHIFDLEWHTRVVEIIPNTSITLRFVDGFFTGGTEIWELEDKNEFIRVSHTIIVRPKGFFRKLIWLLKVRRKHDKMVEAFLEKLKRTSEVLAIVYHHKNFVIENTTLWEN